MAGILDNPDAAYAKLQEMGKGLFGKDGGGLDALLGGLSGGGPRRRRGWRQPRRRRIDRSAASSARPSAI